jgi:hypothetical protein
MCAYVQRKLLAHDSGRVNRRGNLAQKCLVLEKLLQWQEALRSERLSAPVMSDRRCAVLLFSFVSKRTHVSETLWAVCFLAVLPILFMFMWWSKRVNKFVSFFLQVWTAQAGLARQRPPGPHQLGCPPPLHAQALARGPLAAVRLHRAAGSGTARAAVRRRQLRCCQLRRAG